MRVQGQPQYGTMPETTDWEMESTDYDNIESIDEVGPDPVICNALTTLTMYHATKEFRKEFPCPIPAELPTVRYPMENIQHRIDVIPARHWSSRFPTTNHQFQDLISDKINTELETGRVVPSKSSNPIGMFTQPKADKPHEARFVQDCTPRNLVTDKDKISIPSMKEIIDFVGSRPFRSPLDLTDGYHNISIHP